MGQSRVIFRLSALIVALASMHSSTFAASDLSEAAAANMAPNVDFLDRSSRLALQRSNNSRLKSYARSEVDEQTAVANALVAWTESATASGAAAALGRPALALDGSAGELARVPSTDERTGRSVAIDGGTATSERRKPLLPAGEENLMNMMSTQVGKAFDASYKELQYDALLQLSTLYTECVQNGDNAALRAIATRELPKINQRLTDLRLL